MTYVAPTRPADWKTATVKSLADVRFSSVDKKTRPGERPVRLCNYLDVYTREYIRGDEPFMAATATEPEIAQFGLQQGDVLITKDSETPDDIGIPSVIMCQRHDLVCGYHLALLRPDKEQADPVFLSKQLRLPRLAQYFGRMSNGLTRYGLPTAAVENAELWMPPDVKEQTRIAAVLQQVDAAIVGTERGIAKLKLIKAGLLHDLLTRGIDENGGLRDPVEHPELFWEVKGLGLVPRAWDSPRIGDIAVYVGSGVTPTGGSRVYKKRGVLFIRSQNVTFDGLLLDDVAFIDERTHLSMARSQVFAHDVLLNITGASIGRCCPMPDGLGPANVNQHVCAIRIAAPSKADATFLSAALASHIGQRQIDMFNAGSNRQGLNYEQLRGFVIPWPRDADERKRACDVWEKHCTRLEREEAAVAKLRLLKQGLMDDLLTGQKRVALGVIEPAPPSAEAQPRQTQANIYFMRSVLAAEIVEQMHEHATFGHVKFQKTLFLCERMAGLDLETRYHRAAAGPHDSRLMRSVDGQMKKQKWFLVVPRGIGADGKPVGWAYERMEKAGGHREWFEKYWAPARERIQRVIDLLRPLDTKRCEVVATLYSAWEDLLAAGRDVTDAAIVEEVLTNWHESKQAIPRETWIKALGWMRKQGLAPVVTQS